MKKTLCLVFAIVIAVTLCGCGGKTDIPQTVKKAFTPPFCYSVTTPSFGFEYTKSNDSAVMVLDSPDTLKGLTVTRDPGGVTASYDGIVVTLPESTVQKLVALDILADKICEAIDSGEYTLNSKDGVNELTFASGEDTFTVFCGEDGSVDGAKINSQGKTYEFTFLE